MIKIYINDILVKFPEKLDDTICISELDYIQFQLDSMEDEPRVFIEDYELIFEKKSDSFFSERYQFFRESFGYSHLRVYKNDLKYEYSFNVLAEKVTCDQAESIIKYVYTKNPNLLKVNFSRTTKETSLVQDRDTHFESFLDFSQSLVNYLDSKKSILKRLIQKKFTSKKTMEVCSNGSIDPEDVLFNLDKIYHDINSSEILIDHNYYSASELPSYSLQDTYDFAENQIILAGLIYTKVNLNEILNLLSDIDLNESLNSDKEYHSFKKSNNYKKDISKVILKVTSFGVLKRVKLLLKEIDSYIYFFQKKLNITYEGPLYPKLTKITLANSFYKDIFGKIKNIYECGSFGFNNLVAKIKIRSMSKIYEFFCLYKIIESFEQLGFIVTEKLEENGIVKEITLQNNNKIVSLSYEKIITYVGDYQNDKSDLVSVNYNHGKIKEYNYYNPDFVISIQDKTTFVRVFYILDAKFRSFYSLQKSQTLKEIKTKYFDNIKYLNIENRTLSNQPILGNFIIYQGGIGCSLFENIHLKGFINLPLFEIIPLNDSFDDKFVSNLIKFSN
ncbi:hypothetical protein I6M90_04830 [Acinetobacter bereziniae]|uniref:nuclease domain-containing protein n=1 Tax=Acinetobacter bereziniae TaxID=106648 RepID=UPI0019026D16|nr:nuclease domain-containing protein [Acinetobacter bereziniae]MBJ8450876.1 hypothetical protein [Acinetobacter bereziniae]MBJ8455396.1 hypothetical protein [Acinetobacter bereziniae]